MLTNFERRVKVLTEKLDTYENPMKILWDWVKKDKVTLSEFRAIIVHNVTKNIKL